MPFRELHVPPITKRRIVKKPGRKPTGIAAVMGQIGKGLKPEERAVLSGPVSSGEPELSQKRAAEAEARAFSKTKLPSVPARPPWQHEHVIDPAWVKDHAALAAEVMKGPEAPTTIIGNHTVQYLEEILNEKLFDTLRGSPGETHHVYKIDDENHDKMRNHLRDFMQRVVEEAGLVLPEDQDERDLSLDKIEAKLAPDLKGLLKDICKTAIRHLGDNEDELSIEQLCRSVWQNWIVDGAVDCDVTPQECLDFAIESMGSQPVISYIFEGMLPFDAQAAVSDLKRIGVIR